MFMTILKMIDLSSGDPDFIPAENQKSHYDSDVIHSAAILTPREAQNSPSLADKRIFRPPLAAASTRYGPALPKYP
jgi:hypothetical protein